MSASASRLSLAMALTITLVCACQSPAVVGSTCARDDDCAAPLTCRYGRCRSQCAASRDCPAGQRCVATGAGGIGVCTLPAEERCTPDVCAAPLVCVSDQCRTECTTGSDCRTDACVSGSCVEPVSGDDAGPSTVDAGPNDASTQSDAGPTCDTSAWPSDQVLLNGLFSADIVSRAGLRALTPMFLGTFATPTESSVAIPGQIAVAAHPDGGPGHAWVLWVEDPMRTTHMVTVPMDHPESAVDQLIGTGSFINVRSFDLGVDEGSFLGVLGGPGSGTPAPQVWVIDETATGGPAFPVAGYDLGYPSDGLAGHMGVTGGVSAFGGASAVPVRFVVASGDTLRAVDASHMVGVSLSTTFAPGFVAGSGSSGELYVFGDASHAVQVWNLRAGHEGSATAVASAPDGPAAIATLASVPTLAIVAYPSGPTVTTQVLDCSGDCTSMGMGGTAPSGQIARRVALATLGSGVAMATLSADDVAGHNATIALHHVDASGTVTPMSLAWTGPTPGASEQIVDVRIAASEGVDVSGQRGAGILVAVLLRDASAMRDRVWLGGVYGCAPP